MLVYYFICNIRTPVALCAYPVVAPSVVQPITPTMTWLCENKFSSKCRSITDLKNNRAYPAERRAIYIRFVRHVSEVRDNGFDDGGSRR